MFSIYNRALILLFTFLTFSGALIQFSLISSISEKMFVIALAVISMSNTVIKRLLTSSVIQDWCWCHRYKLVVIEGLLGVSISLGMLIVGVTPISLFVRWLINSTIGETLLNLYASVFEKIKEDLNDGRNIQAEKDLSVQLGTTFGFLLCATCVILEVEINKNALLYMHGFICLVENIGFAILLRRIDKEKNLR